ncbi:hypothetical protein [Methylobacterium sp. J-067]|uniref:hypothetical protein n=1 Tax=Methylobacterium sp. J-067 TaxID=2836648 RepID=UPI001FBB57F5|nr:hypothetical protein [Methylobacterium sp. J-067]MCJ2023620.1 hypothetical protein [Methylobacterium sp. J-067]
MADFGEARLSDEEIDRRARQLFAEVRAEQSEAKAARALATAGEAAGEIVPGLPDWLQDADVTPEDAGSD